MAWMDEPIMLMWVERVLRPIVTVGIEKWIIFHVPFASFMLSTLGLSGLLKVKYRIRGKTTVHHDE
jgi:hypothetical protein